MKRKVQALGLLVVSMLWLPGVPAAERAAVVEPCKHDEERDGVLCYPRCKSGYEGDGEECVEKCPANSQDYGNKCLMGPAAVLKKFYTRGPGRAVD